MLNWLRLRSKDAEGLHCRVGVDIIFEGTMHLPGGESPPLGQVSCGRGQAHKGNGLGGTADVVGDGGWDVFDCEAGELNGVVQLNVNPATVALQGKALPGGNLRGQESLQWQHTFVHSHHTGSSCV